MTTEQILKRAIEKAVENGWKLPKKEIEKAKLLVGANPHIIFDPEWAKSFINGNMDWRKFQHELLDAIQSEEDPILCLENHLDS